MAQKLGIYERPIESIIREHLKKGDVFFDIGANIGYFSLLAAYIAEEAGHVYCFEPLPQNITAISHHMKINSITSYTIINKAISDVTGTAQFSVGDGTRSSLFSDETDNQIEVELTTLDETLKTSRFPQMVKIDVEGAEQNVLRGASTMIYSASPPTLIIEIHDEPNERAVREILAHADYDMQRLVAYVPRNTVYPFHIFAQKKTGDPDNHV